MIISMGDTSNTIFKPDALTMIATWHCTIVSVFLLSILCSCCYGYEDYELDLYDLVEEVSGTFYEFMGLDNNCESSDVRKAYRRLSLVLHPDKNKEENAEVKFRQLVGIYEILKNSEKRKKYDDILVNGLPTWRQPIYYYRKVRKFGFAESALVIVVTVSVINFAMMWAAYWERKYTIEEFYTSKLKKDSKRRNHLEKNDELMDEMQRSLDALQKPRLTQMIVIRVVIGTVIAIMNLPSTIKFVVEEVKRKKAEKEQAGLDSDDEGDSSDVRRKTRCDGVFSNMAEPEMVSSSSVQPVVYQHTKEPVDSTMQSFDTESTKQSNKKSQWTDLDDSNLARAMQKFPPGTAMRWEKIAQQINRTPEEVLTRAKKLKDTNFAAAPESKSSVKLPDTKRKMDVSAQGGISVREVAHSGVDNSSVTQSIQWSQVQQKALEAALASVPKTSPDRWGDIAKLVPDKSKAECMARYKYLAEVVKQKRQMKVS